MSTIRDIAGDVARQYPREAEPILHALETREIAMRATITQGARNLGASDGQIDRILDAAGLGVTSIPIRDLSSNGRHRSEGSDWSPPEAFAQSGTKSERIADLENRVGALEVLAMEARQRGLV
jgi:hypothetical protein